MTGRHQRNGAINGNSDMTDDGRRRLLASIGAAGLVAGGLGAGGLAPTALQAQSPDAAAALVNQVVADVLRIINSGGGEAARIREFERIFRDYADVPLISQSVVGVEWRSASSADRSAFMQSFQGYMARKYGRRFQEFAGGQITVTGARPSRNHVEVASTAVLQGSAPFEVFWFVSSLSGRPRFFNIVFAGFNLRVTEQNQIRSLLDARGGDLARLAADLRSLG